MKSWVIILLAIVPLVGQQCQINGPLNSTACTQILAYDGSNNLLYICRARSIQPNRTRLSITAASNASPVSLTITAHGFNTNQKPTVTISGGTGSWVAVNGTFTATITGANTLTIPVDSTAFGALAGTVVLDTYAPIASQAVWAMAKFTYDGSNNLTGMFFPGGASSERNVCSAPAQYQ